MNSGLTRCDENGVPMLVQYWRRISAWDEFFVQLFDGTWIRVPSASVYESFLADSGSRMFTYSDELADAAIEHYVCRHRRLLFYGKRVPLDARSIWCREMMDAVAAVRT